MLQINAKESGALDEVEKIENKIKEDEAIVQEEKEEIIRLEVSQSIMEGYISNTLSSGASLPPCLPILLST